MKEVAEEKRASVESAVRKIQKKYGDGRGGLMIGMASDIPPTEYISSGLLSLDRVMNGGFPRGHFNVVYGAVGSGKTTLVCMTIAEAQREGLECIYISAEARFSPEWAEHLGVDLTRLHVLPQGEHISAEEILDVYIGVAEARAADLIVVDSVSALSPMEELDKAMNEGSMALTPRVLSKFFRKATGVNYAAGICGILVAQTRDTLDMYPRKLDSLTGGHALKHYSQYIIQTSRKNAKEGVNIVSKNDGFVITLDMAKATGPGEGRRLEYEFIRATTAGLSGSGIDTDLDIISIAIEMGIIEKPSSGMYTIPNSISGEDAEEALKIRGYSKMMKYILADGRIDRIKELVCGSMPTYNGDLKQLEVTPPQPSPEEDG